MIWTMMKRELLDSIVSLRFYVTSALVISVIAVGAVISVGNYQEGLGDYNRCVKQNQEKVRDYAKSLSTLGTASQSLYKRPKVLSLCASGEEKDLSNAISVAASQISNERNVARRNFMLSRFSNLDWTFIIGVIFSFVALLLSYDAVCGEKETGTLRLTSSNPVPRTQILLAKFLGTGITLLIPFLIGIVLSPIIATSSDQIALGGADWTRISLTVLVSLIYLATFVTLGLFVSSRTSASSTSLVLLLFLWVILVIVIPSSGGLIASGFYKLPSLSEIEEQKKTAVQAAYDEYKFKDITSSSSNPKLESNKT